MDMKECKAVAIRHWEKNITALRSMNWAGWTKISRHERRFMAKNFAFGLLFIFGELCPYCHVFQASCKGCPLSDAEEERMCCEAWLYVRDAFVDEPTTMEHALEAFQKMLDYIKEKG